MHKDTIVSVYDMKDDTMLIYNNKDGASGSIMLPDELLLFERSLRFIRSLVRDNIEHIVQEVVAADDRWDKLYELTNDYAFGASQKHSTGE